MDKLTMKKLPNAPLQEVLFEIYWDLDYNANGFPFDNDFGLAKGKFSALIENNFPFAEQLLPENITIPQQVALRFWTAEKNYPVIQIGHGVLTVNDTEKNYIWEDNYKPLILETIDFLQKSYKKVLKYNRLRLKYIDAVDISDDEYANVKVFIKENLQVSLENTFEIADLAKDIQIGQSFKLADNSNFSLTISTGFNQQKQQYAVVWSLEVDKSGDFSQDEITDWLEFAHSKTSDTFKNMLNPTFYDSFTSRN